MKIIATQFAFLTSNQKARKNNYKLNRFSRNAVPGTLDCRHQTAAVGGVGGRDLGAFSCEIYSRLYHTRHGTQRAFDPAHARGAGHAFHGQGQRRAVLGSYRFQGGVHRSCLSKWLHFRQQR